MRITVTVKPENVGALITAIGKTKLADSFDVRTDDDAINAETDAIEMDALDQRGPQRANVADVAPVRNVFHARPGKRVLYTPALTKAKMSAALAKLDGSSMRAMVLADVAKHPKTSNADVRKRLTKRAAKLGLSVESVDNVIWQAVNRGELAKLSAD